MSDTPDEFRRRLESEDYADIPPATRSAIYRYVVHRQKPGSALTALLQGSVDCIVMASERVYPTLPKILWLLHNYAPSQCHGTEERVRSWLRGETPRPSHWPDDDDAVRRLGMTA